MTLSPLFIRLEDIIGAQTPNDQKTFYALSRIGMLITARAKIEATKMGIVDKGTLRASIQYRIMKNGESNMTLIVGSFGVPYAARNHFGGPVSRRQIRKMFEEMAREGPPRPGKGILRVTKSGAGFWKARPFLQRAITQSKTDIITILRESYGG